MNMISLSKNMLLFSGIMVFASISFVAVLQKLPRLISHATYYCQSALVSFLTPVPKQLLLLPLIVFFLFLSGALGKLVFILIKTYLLKKNLVKQVMFSQQLQQLLERLRIQEDTYLINSPKPFAFCLGIIKPKIYVSKALIDIMNIQELETILHHEKYHLKHRDTLTMFFAVFGTSLFPFFPILSDFVHNYRIERELRADKEAIHKTGSSRLLVSVLKKLLNTNPFPSFAFAYGVADYDSLEPRIKALLQGTFPTFQKFKTSNIAISIFFIFALVFAISGPVHGMHMHSNDHHIMMLHPRQDECLVWAKDLKVHP